MLCERRYARTFTASTHLPSGLFEPGLQDLSALERKPDKRLCYDATVSNFGLTFRTWVTGQGVTSRIECHVARKASHSGLCRHTLWNTRRSRNDWTSQGPGTSPDRVVCALLGKVCISEFFDTLGLISLLQADSSKTSGDIETIVFASIVKV